MKTLQQVEPRVDINKLAGDGPWQALALIARPSPSRGAINGNTGNLVIVNHSRSNAGGNFTVSSGNAVGPILITSQVLTTTIPTANFGP